MMNMSKIISCTRACQIAKIAKNTLLRYLRNGDFPASIENPKGYFLFWDNDVINWTKLQKEAVTNKWNEKRYEERKRTMDYIAQIEKQLIVDRLVSDHLRKSYNESAALNHLSN